MAWKAWGHELTMAALVNEERDVLGPPTTFSGLR